MLIIYKNRNMISGEKMLAHINLRQSDRGYIDKPIEKEKIDLQSKKLEQDIKLIEVGDYVRSMKLQRYGDYIF